MIDTSNDLIKLKTAIEQFNKSLEMPTPIEFSDDILKLIYGKTIDIEEVRNLKCQKDIWYDILKKIGKSNVSEIDKIRKMNMIDIFNYIQSEISTMNIPHNVVGFKINKSLKSQNKVNSF